MMAAPRASLVGRRNYPGVPMAQRQQAKPADPRVIIIVVIAAVCFIPGQASIELYQRTRFRIGGAASFCL
jgi:hypothetical protein